ncbi:phage protein NinX family protein [Herbaspirillum huttiense]|uniref:DUF2591 family protein n=2 Tax=Herbaspirillum huttiense TaxID=863372 RepID=A0AAJ2LUH4_9BURK|nr:phage protein NinX family protein [Herbaspirillum huttiense]MDR9839404.1 DUF2591 family protein [Herbaspirillum huttiense]
MKTAELEGTRLNYWVARADDFDHAGADFVQHVHDAAQEWYYGGPLIERERIAILPQFEDGKVSWRATNDKVHRAYDGPTPLIAAMRAFVASRFGDEVPDIKETA